MSKCVYISATEQDSGKTAVSMGLMHLLVGQGLNPGYMKPVGQHYEEYFGSKVDEDAVLFHIVFGLKDNPSDMSPIAIERGFTEKFINKPDVRPLEKKIVDSYKKLSKEHDIVIVEGTGHAGVGSCFGLSNARVAQILGAKVVIVATGGIGRPMDEIALSMALFKQHNVEVIGVVLNKVLPEKFDKVHKTVSKGLKIFGTELVGAIPFDNSLTTFTVGQLAEQLKYDVLFGKHFLSSRIENIVVAAMRPEHSLKYIRKNTLVITPSDRYDAIKSSVKALKGYYPNIGGLMLTGGFSTDAKSEKMLKDSGIPVLVSKSDTFSVSSAIAKLGFKIQSYEDDKIKKLYKLVKSSVDTKKILKTL